MFFSSSRVGDDLNYLLTSSLYPDDAVMSPQHVLIILLTQLT